MDAIKERLDRAEEDIRDLKQVWKLLHKIELQQEKILTKLDQGHLCKQDTKIQSLEDFKLNAEKTIENSISKNQAALYIIFSIILSSIFGFVIGLPK